MGGRKEERRKEGRGGRGKKERREGKGREEREKEGSFVTKL